MSFWKEDSTFKKGDRIHPSKRVNGRENRMNQPSRRVNEGSHITL
jgi:hypothetical protein